MLHTSRPSDFTPKFEIVSLFLEYNGKILLLHRHAHKSQGGKWGVPAGKVETGETLEDALKREVFEETGYTFQEAPAYFKSVFVEYPEHSFIYHMYALQLPKAIEVKIEPYEHQAYRWVTPASAIKMNLVDDLDECIRMYYGTVR